MSGIMMLANPNWIAYHRRHSIGKVVGFYASRHKQTYGYDHLICIHPGAIPRKICAVGRISSQKLLHQDDAWAKYGTTLGAIDERGWRNQAKSVLGNSSETYGGEILVIELADFQVFSEPVEHKSVGLTDTRWSDKKAVNKEATDSLLKLLKREDQTHENEYSEFEQNKETEDAAVSFVITWYQKRGWQVTSVEQEKCGYDLKCIKNSGEENVEVKGLSSNEQKFIITANEQNQAKTNELFMICIVTEARSNRPVIHRYSGEEFLAKFLLTPTQYRATMRMLA